MAGGGEGLRYKPKPIYSWPLTYERLVPVAAVGDGNVPAHTDIRHPDVSGSVQSMAAALIRHGADHPEFVFKVLDGHVLRTLYVDLTMTSSQAIVTVVAAAYALNKPLHIGLSGARPGDVAWVELSRPSLPRDL